MFIKIGWLLGLCVGRGELEGGPTGTAERSSVAVKRIEKLKPLIVKLWHVYFKEQASSFTEELLAIDAGELCFSVPLDAEPAD